MITQINMYNLLPNFVISFQTSISNTIKHRGGFNQIYLHSQVIFIRNMLPWHTLLKNTDSVFDFIYDIDYAPVTNKMIRKYLNLNII